MRTFIISDSERFNTVAREVLLRQGYDCPAAYMVPIDHAAEQLAPAQPELVLLVLPGDVERGLAALGELRSLTTGRLLLVGPTADSKLVLRALRMGADDYIDEAEVEAELEAALRRHKGESAAPVELGRTIAILAPSGGSGCSTLAVNVATVLAKVHESAVLWDLKLEAGDLAALLDLKPTHTLADVCQNVTRLDRVMFERCLVRHASGVQLLAPPRDFAALRHVTPEGVRQALSLARVIFPYVVVDLDHSLRDEQVQVVRQADVILVVLRLDFTSLRNTRRTLNYLSQLGVSADRIHVVANRYGQPKEVPAAKAEEALERKIFHYVPDDPKTINRANNSGVPAVLEYPSASVSKSVMKLAHSINGRH
jgi:pilus assembly protein CpaE